MVGNKIYCFEVVDFIGVVRFMYEEMPEEWHKFTHKRAGAVEDNIQDTVNNISEGSVMYVVNTGGKLAAYFVWHKTLEGDLILEGFHVLKEFRTRPFLTEFWQIVKDKFNGPFKTGIYCKNEQAIKSLLKAGFEVFNVILYEQKVFIILKFE